MDYRLIAEENGYVLIQRGSRMQQYAVVNGLDLFKALDDFRSKTDRDYISHDRLLEIVSLMKDALVEDGADEAYEYMRDTVELSESEAEALGLDMEEYDKYGRKNEKKWRQEQHEYRTVLPDTAGTAGKDF